jgi:hypothetical protein
MMTIIRTIAFTGIAIVLMKTNIMSISIITTVTIAVLLSVGHSRTVAVFVLMMVVIIGVGIIGGGKKKLLNEIGVGRSF